MAFTTSLSERIMKTKSNLGGLRYGMLAILCLFLRGPAHAESPVPTSKGPPNKGAEAIAWSEIGPRAGADYKGDGLSVAQTEKGALLRCVFQRLEGQATTEGLWLTSTLTNQRNDCFRVKAVAVGRNSSGPVAPDVSRLSLSLQGVSDGNSLSDRADLCQLPPTGMVEEAEKLVRFIRPGLVEEYTVSMDGVRQDFVVLEKPARTGRKSAPNERLQSNIESHPSRLKSVGADPSELRVELAVTGAKVDMSAQRGQLVLEESGRRIAYSRLRVTDANGKELPAWIEVQTNSEFRIQNSEFDLAVVVSDADAVYPIRIDPTFSDANWISMGGVPGAGGPIYATVVDDSGNLYIGGDFSVVGDVFASRIAKWNGSSWSPLGSGMNNTVIALAVSGRDLYAGGHFTTAGGIAANYIAKWNGSGWSALGSGMGALDFPSVQALAVSGGDLYAGGNFTMAGGVDIGCGIAKWDGSSWKGLGSGMNFTVYALAVSGGDVYVGGNFTTAGGTAVNNIAKWDGSSWSALGSGMNSTVFALAASGGDLYAGGNFTTAGGIAANYIAKWDGSKWSALASGMDGWVYALAVSSSDLYTGGNFTTAGGIAATNIAKWNGSSWSALGSGMNKFGYVYALAVSGCDLYAGGSFTTAGGSPANCIAKWDGSSWSALGSGMSAISTTYVPTVFALAVLTSELYAGGWFTTVGGVSANYITKWNGFDWSALGSGMNYRVIALALSGGKLSAGGDFLTAGGKLSYSVAQAVLGNAPRYNQLTGAPLSGTMQFSYVGDPATNYALDRAADLSPPISWTGQQTNTMTISGVLLFTNTPTAGTNNFWRVRSLP